MIPSFTQQLPLSILVLCTAFTLACDADDESNTASTSTPQSTTATSIPDTVRPSPTSFPTVPTGEAMITDCPVDDVTLCEFALDLEDALNADTIGFITERLASEERPCQDVFHDAGEDVGCTDPQATSLPVVTLLRFQGDCCSTLVENFEPQLVEWINENANQDTWRLYALVPNAPTWEGGAEILLVRGGDDDAPTIGIGTNRDEQHVSIPGAIIGARNALFIGQDEELLPWR